MRPFLRSLIKFILTSKPRLLLAASWSRANARSVYVSLSHFIVQALSSTVEVVLEMVFRFQLLVLFVYS